MKKGFTLIELLAVIIILAVIALIATPIIVGLIDNARKEAFKNSAYGVVKAGEILYSKDLLNGTKEEVTFTYTDGVESSSIPGKKLDYNGSKPNSGTVMVNSEGKIAIAIHNGTYCAEKGYGETNITLVSRNVGDCIISNIGKPSPPQGEVANSLNDADGDGFLDIWYLEQLSYIRTNSTTLGQNYELMRNLDFQNSSSYLDSVTNKTLWTTGAGWVPIGPSSTEYFYGILEGNNFAIDNLYINGGSRVGIFGSAGYYQYVDGVTTYYPAHIRNLTMNNADVYGSNSGSLVGYFYNGTIDNVKITNSSIVGSHVGGLVGDGRVAISRSSVTDTTITGSYSGGLIGGLNANSPYDKIELCYVENVTILGNTWESGGLIGGSSGTGAKIINSYARANVNNVLAGGLNGDQHGTFTNSYFAGILTGSTPGGICADYGSSSTITSSYWDTELSGTTNSAGVGGVGLTTAQMKQQSSYSGWNFDTIWAIDPNKNNGYPYLKIFENDID